MGEFIGLYDNGDLAGLVVAGRSSHRGPAAARDYGAGSDLATDTLLRLLLMGTLSAVAPAVDGILDTTLHTSEGMSAPPTSPFTGRATTGPCSCSKEGQAFF